MDMDVDVERRLAAENVLGLGENVFDEGAGNDAEPDFAIDAAEGQVVDLVAERRDVGALGGVEIDGENIFTGKVDVRGEMEGERRVAAFVFAELGAVDPDGGGGHGAFEIDEDVFAARFGGELEFAAVERDEFVALVIETVPGELRVGVRNHDAFELRVVE